MNTIKCAVIGAANTDIAGVAAGVCRAGDSNIGRITATPGGVGLNIACNLALLGCKTSLITAFGGDERSEALRRCLTGIGVDIHRSLTFPEASGSGYLYIADSKGEMRLAINDMDIYSRMTPERLESRIDWLNAMDFAVIDANLPEETVLYLCRKLSIPLIADAVSAAKVRRLERALPFLSLIKLNRIEAEALTGCADPAGAAESLLRQCAGRVFITLGKDGVYGSDGKQAFRMNTLARDIRSSTGAGDAFTAASALALAMHMPMENAARFALAASAVAMRSPTPVNPAMDFSDCMQIAGIIPDKSLKF